MNKEKILGRFREELSRSSDHTISSRVFYARKFLEYVGDSPQEWNRAAVEGFLDQLKGEGAKVGWMDFGKANK